MSTNGRPSALAAYSLDEVPQGVLEVVTEWMKLLGTKELTFSVHENKVTIKSSVFFRTTL